MPLTLYLSKVLGIGLVILGVIIMARRNYFLPVFATLVEERLVRAIMAIMELMAGLFLIVSHNVWSSLPAAIISLLGWMAVIEGTLYLILPDDLIRKFIGIFNTATGYIAGGLLAVVTGVYLMGSGFLWW